MRKYKRKKKVTTGGKFKLKIFIWVLVFIIIFAIYCFMRKSLWDGKSKLNLAVRVENFLTVLIFDPENSEIVRIIVPGETEINVSRGLGVVPVKNLWILGEKSGIGGKLVSETVTRSLLIPTIYWADKEALGLGEGSKLAVIKTLFSFYKTNLPLADKVKITIFALTVNNSRITDISLQELGYIKKAILKDESEGYLIADKFPNELLAVLGDDEISDGQVRVSIRNSTGNVLIPQDIGKIISVMGGKVSSVESNPLNDSDCLVVGSKKSIVVKIASVFSCDWELRGSESLFDVDMSIGSEFLKRF